MHLHVSGAHGLRALDVEQQQACAKHKSGDASHHVRMLAGSVPSGQRLP